MQQGGMRRRGPNPSCDPRSGTDAIAFHGGATLDQALARSGRATARVFPVASRPATTRTPTLVQLGPAAAAGAMCCRIEVSRRYGDADALNDDVEDRAGRGGQSDPVFSVDHLGEPRGVGDLHGESDRTPPPLRKGIAMTLSDDLTKLAARCCSSSPSSVSSRSSAARATSSPDSSSVSCATRWSIPDRSAQPRSDPCHD